MLLCYLYHFKNAADSPGVIELFRHNFKKFFAEQLFYFHNSIFSRSILLETLLYEQKIIVPVFEAKNHDEELEKNATAGSQIMSNLGMFHEFGHFS